jgi:polyphosphate kinase
MRKVFYQLIDSEIASAKRGEKAEIIIKLNSLQDTKMIHRLYEANNAGVKIKIIVRGICCLIPGIAGMSENIEVTSIVDRYLEHARIYIFHNGGNELIFSGSADWMRRNLSRRIEVIFPILNNRLKNQIKDIIQLQLNDNVKARIIDPLQKNEYQNPTSEKITQAQLDTFSYLQKENM